MINILWMIVALFIALCIVSVILAILGFMVHVAFFLLKWAFIAALVLTVINLILGRRQV